MGLSIRIKTEREILNRNLMLIERLKTADLRLEENEDIVRTIQYIAENESINLVHFDLLRSYLKNIFDEDIAEWMMLSIVREDLTQSNVCKLIEHWRLEGAEIDTNVLLAAIKNKSFKKAFRDRTLDFFDANGPFEDFYNAYVDGVFGLEEANDENSVIFNVNLWLNTKDDIKKYIQIDNSLKSDPEKRKKIMYKEDDSLRSLSYIERDLEA